VKKLVQASKAAVKAARAVFVNQGTLKNPGTEWDYLTNTLLGQVAAASGIKVTAKNAMGVSTVFACVNVISRAMASTPVKLYRKGSDGSKREVEDDIRADMLKSEPNPEITGFDFLMAMQANLSLRNNAFAQIRRDSLDRPVELIPIENTEIDDIRRDQVTKKIRYYVRGEPYSQKNILHLKGLSFSGYYGCDLVNTAREAIGLAIALETSASAFFRNGQRPGLVASHPSQLGDQAYNRLTKALQEEHEGPEKNWKFLLLEEGLQLVNNRQSNQESQFSESRKDQALDIARFFGVPPHKVGIESNLPRANVEEQNIEFVTDTLAAHCVLWEQQLNRWLLTKQERMMGYYFKFNLNSQLRGALGARFEAYSKARQWGWMSVNDIRRLEDMNPIENGDIYLEPQNMIEAGKQALKQALES